MKKNCKGRVHGYSKLMFFVVVCIIQLISAKANTYKVQEDIPPIVGRWDLTIYMDGKEYPSWLEVQKSGLSTLVGEFVGTGGSARPVSRINFNDGKISFTLPPQWEKGNDLSFEGNLMSDSLSGTMVSADGKNYNWSGVRAPLLKRSAQPVLAKTYSII